ncbi:hypothetical protein AB0M02_33465 [Actinoplanes sp. NPDC051861]|uniref:hypothetical protein n=1 Tax=Actinoplanes sp. NPDC051861 TaxID=3155170 RepID=UPI00341A6EC9
MFLHPPTGRLWFVKSVGDGEWDWGGAGAIDPRSEMFEAARALEALMLRAESVIATKGVK